MVCTVQLTILVDQVGNHRGAIVLDHLVLSPSVAPRIAYSCHIDVVHVGLHLGEIRHRIVNLLILAVSEARTGSGSLRDAHGAVVHRPVGLVLGFHFRYNTHHFINVLFSRGKEIDAQRSDLGAGERAAHFECILVRELVSFAGITNESSIVLGSGTHLTLQTSKGARRSLHTGLWSQPS